MACPRERGEQVTGGQERAREELGSWSLHFGVLYTELHPYQSCVGLKMMVIPRFVVLTD
jgi:hypothetical protein